MAATFPLNTDGIDITGKDVYFRNLSIENYDDAVGIKPSNAQSLWSNCTENVLVEDSYVKYGVGKKYLIICIQIITNILKISIIIIAHDL